MALVYADRVKDTSTTTGTGTYTLSGTAPTGFQSFGAGIGNANTCYYAATDSIDWEVGLGTYTSAGTTLARTSILASSNANAAVSWSAGTRTLWVDLPASIIAAFVSSARSLTAAGLVTGGGDLSADRTFTVTGASQSDQETSTSTTVAVTPAVQQFHPSAAKFWAAVNGAGSSLLASYNVTSITDTGTGNLLITIATDFSSANWACTFSGGLFGATNNACVMTAIGTIAAGTVQLRSFSNIASGSGSTAPSAVDPSSYGVSGFGDQ